MSRIFCVVVLGLSSAAAAAAYAQTNSPSSSPCGPENWSAGQMTYSTLPCADTTAQTPQEAAIPPSGVAYCEALAQKYQRYVGDNEAQHRSQTRDAAVDSAIAQCPANSGAAIPVLERALKDAKVDLPTHG